MDINLLISIGGTILSAIITSAGTLALINYRLKKLEENVNELTKEVKSITADVLVLKTEKAVREKTNTYELRNSHNKSYLAAKRLNKLLED